MTGRPLEYQMQFVHSWLAFLVEDQTSVDYIRSVGRAMNVWTCLCTLSIPSISASLVLVALSPSHRTKQAASRGAVGAS
jgi:hypothetical protein